MRWYVDSSAAAKLLVAEAESQPLTDLLVQAAPELVACQLLETELRRLAVRSARIPQAEVSRLLDHIALYEVTPSMFREAGVLAGSSLRSLDAIHCVAAVRLGVDAVLTYDLRMAEAVRALGIEVLAPDGGEVDR